MKNSYGLFFFIILWVTPAFGSNNNLDEQLKALKKADNLTEWIDLGIEQASQHTGQSLQYLDETEKKSWRTPKTASEKEAWLYLLINQAYYQLYYGDINNSINKYEAAYSYYKSEKSEVDVEEYILRPLGNNYTRIGDFERAIFIQNQSLAIAKTKKNDTLAASLYNNLAISYLSKGDINDAKKQVLLGLKLAKETNMIYGLLYSTQAKILFEEKDYPKALISANKAIKHLKQDKNTNYWQISAYDIIANIELENKNYASAEQHIKEALSIASAERKREFSTLYMLKSRLFLQKKDYTTAINAIDEALSALDNQFDIQKGFPNGKDLYPEIKLQLALVLKADILAATEKKEEALKGYMLANRVSELLRSGYTYQFSKKKQQQEAKNIAEKIIATAFDLWSGNKNEQYAKLILETSEQTKARLLFDEIKFNQERFVSKNKAYADILALERSINYYEKQKRIENTNRFDKKLEELRFQLSSLNKENNIQNYTLQVKADQLIGQIPKNTLALVFFTGEHDTYIITASSMGIAQVIKLQDSELQTKTIGNFLNTYFYKGPGLMINKPKVFFEKSYKIYESIFASLNLKGYRDLLIIKDGIYNYLSFDGLITANYYSKKIKEWPFLILQKKIRYQYSLYNFPNREQGAANLLFSGFFLSRTDKNAATIPSVNYEYNTLKNMIDGYFYSNERATSEVLKEKIKSSNILHISSHAHLADATSEPILELYNEKFYLFDIEPNISFPQLVVLNACQTGNGEYISGEGVESLGRGFLAAGTKAVISSLWRVNDEAGAKILVLFYKNLLKTNNPAEALRQAKLDWIHSNKNSEIMGLPYYWDSTIYTGSEMQITFNKAFNKTFYMIVAGFIAAVLLLIIVIYIAQKSSKPTYR